MALDPSNFLSTPAGSANPGQIAQAQQLSEASATPQQIQAMYDYAKALRTSSQDTPVKAWTQGVSNVVKALMGNTAENQAESADRGRFNAQASAYQEPDTSHPGDLPGFGTIDTNRPPITGGDAPSDPGLAHAESGGNDQAKNPMSSAAGRYQFTDGTWKDVATRHPDLSLTPDGRMDPVQQEKAKGAYTGDNDKVLQAAGYEPNRGNEDLAMRFGATGATKVLGADPSAPMGSIMPSNVMVVNPDLRNATAGSTVQRYASLGNPQMPGAPSLPPDAQATVRALNPQMAQNGPMQPGQMPPGGTPDPRAMITQITQRLIRTGIDPKEAQEAAASYVNNQIAYGPQYTVSPNTGAIVSQQPGQMPRIAGSLENGGPATPMAGIPGTYGQQYIGPDGLTHVRTIQAQWPSSPQTPGTLAVRPPVAPTGAPPGAPSGTPPSPWPAISGAPTAPVPAQGGIPAPTPAATLPQTALPQDGASTTSATGAPPYPANAEEARTYPDRMKAWEAGQEKIQEAGATAAVEPLKEVLTRGGQRAQDYETVIDRMNDAYNAAKQYGGVGGGPAKDKILEFQELVNEFAPGTFEPNKVAAAEDIKKSTSQLVLNQLKEANPRFGQREFMALLNNNPSISISDTGSQYLLGLARQQVEQDKKLAVIAGESLRANDPYGFQKKVNDFYNDPANQTKSPFDPTKTLADSWKDDAKRLEKESAPANAAPTAAPGLNIPKPPPPAPGNYTYDPKMKIFSPKQIQPPISQ